MSSESTVESKPGVLEGDRASDPSGALAPLPAPVALELDAHGWLMLFVSLASVLGILLLSASFFRVPLLLGSTFVACVLVHRVGRVAAARDFLGWGAGLIVILAVGVVLRADVYPHMMGGQDQGLYTNYSVVMLREGALNFVDHFREELPDGLRAAYDRCVLGSVGMVDPQRSLMTIEFYPLHPMWMAVFSWAFGPTMRTLSLLFFSIIYIWSGRKLAQRVFASETAGLLAAFLLATNPILVFFSKFPVTEMVALTFSMNGFLYLIEGVRASAPRQKWLYLGIATLSFCAFFFTRIHFMLYLPFLGLVVVGAAAVDWKASLRSGLVPAIVALCLLFGLSLGWYFVFQRVLVTSLFEAHLSRLMSLRTLVEAALAAVGLVCGLWLLRRFSRAGAFKAPVSWALEHAGKLFVLSLLLSVPSLVNLYRTGLMPPYDQWVLDTSDPWLFRYHVLYRLLLFLSPVGLLALAGGALLGRGLPALAGLLLLFLATAWGVVLLQPTQPYLFYFGRYLASDVLPYSLVALAGLMAHFARGGRPKVAWLVLATVGAYQVFFSFNQLGHLESEAPGTLEGFASHVRPNDVILAVQMDSRLLVPLRVSKELRVFSVVSLDVTGDAERREELLALQAFALKTGGRLLIASPLANAQRIGTFLGGASLKTSFFSNGEHPWPSLSGYQQIGAREALLLPLGHEAREERWVFYDATTVDLEAAAPFLGPCATIPGKDEAATCLELEAYVKRLYLDLLGREADPEGLRVHLDQLIHGGSRDELRRSFMKSSEYRQLQGAPTAP